ncbi:YcaO-like family protein [Dongia rigui]|uniref:YcaO-like family protein n=1 Tax=Dongia rigui TaxID=940149 RepID=A0ABU5DZI8_9PROT|nr:YcaO-like family protein [Dongia rigui]MDY0872694.1 YcaO-like family protein [Dongia rigui]
MFTEAFFESGEADPRDLRQLGITRVGDITDLDCIGIPVWFACRPNSRALSVSQGKGKTPALARISAVMEAAEGAIAERPEDVVACFATPDEMAAAARPTVPFARMMRCQPGRIQPTRRYAWVRGFTWRERSEIFAPYELVGLDMRADTPWDHTAFKMSSIGLAGSNSLDRAVIHGLLEVLEHDATASLDLFGLGAGIARPVKPAVGAHPTLDRLVEQVRSAGFEPRFFSLPTRVPVPVVGCFFERLVASADGAGATLTAGFACRPDAHDAAIAALLECVQSRATDIAGSRDDISELGYSGSKAQLPRETTTPLSGFQHVDGHLPQSEMADAGAQLEHFLACLAHAGIDDFYFFPLARPELGIEVVRILAPDLGTGNDSGVAQGSANLIDALLKGLA